MNILLFRRSNRAKALCSLPARLKFTAGASAALLAAVCASWGSAGNLADAATGGDNLAASFSYCGSGQRVNCVVDGDTFWFDGRKIRIADINTPELSGAQCADEKLLAQHAKRRMTALLNDGNFSLVTIIRDRDKYGRLLRIVERDGSSLGEILVGEGLAERWQGRRSGWCGRGSNRS